MRNGLISRVPWTMHGNSTEKLSLIPQITITLGILAPESHPNSSLQMRYHESLQKPNITHFELYTIISRGASSFKT